MFFRVEHLGPLREAEVDLSKGLILLTGPNNTGKTYLAWSIYGLHRNPSAPTSLRALLEEMMASPTQSVGIERLREVWPNVLKELGQRLAEQMHLCFGAPRATFPDVRVTLNVGGGEPESFGTSQYSLRTSKGIASFALSETEIGMNLPEASQERVSRRAPKASKHSSAQLPDELSTPFSQWLVYRQLHDCILWPAERTAIDVFARELWNSRNIAVHKVKEVELRGGTDISAIRQLGSYPWPIEDSLYIANNLVDYADEEVEFADLAKELERLLGGTVALSDDGEFRFMMQEHPDRPIAVHLSSSSVKSLASLVFFLRYRAERGDLLIIDEPELNLHPDNQRRVTRILAKAVNRGLRVIMSTHSDYVLREINNLILLGRDSEAIKSVREKHGYTTDELLPPGKVGPYLFRSGGCEAIAVTENGFEVKTIEDEINRLNEISQDIYAALL